MAARRVRAARGPGKGLRAQLGLCPFVQSDHPGLLQEVLALLGTGTTPTAWTGLTPGVAPTTAGWPGVAPTTKAWPGVAPTTKAWPGVAPTTKAWPGVAPTTKGWPGIAPTTKGWPGIAPTTKGWPGVAPTTKGWPGYAPTTKGWPGYAPTTKGWPGLTQQPYWSPTPGGGFAKQYPPGQAGIPYAWHPGYGIVQ